MKMLESQIVSLLIHGAFLIFVVFYFVPPKVISQGQGLLVELMQASPAKGIKAKAPKVSKAKKEVISKPVVIATKPKVKKVVKKTLPKKAAPETPVAKIQKAAVVTQQEKSFVAKKKQEKSSQLKNAQLPPKAVDEQVDPQSQIVKTKVPSPAASRSTGRKPAPPAAAPVVGEKKYSLSEALGQQNGVKDARRLSQKPGNIPPTYPTSDRLDNNQGRVTLLAYVNGAGQVEDIQIENSTGSYLMEAEAVRAFSRYKFSENQPGWVRMPYEFQLSGPAKDLHAKWDEAEEDVLEEATLDISQ